MYNSLTVYDISWALKFDNFSEFQNMISDSLPTHERHYDVLSTKIDMWLTPNSNVSVWSRFYAVVLNGVFSKRWNTQKLIKFSTCHWENISCVVCDPLRHIYEIFGQDANFQWFSQFFMAAIKTLFGIDNIQNIKYCHLVK